MQPLEPDRIDELRRQWTDALVLTRAEIPEWRRFADRPGRVITVNNNGKALVDFNDGAWYDIPASADYLTVLPGDDPRRAKYDPKVNSAQPRPERQG